MSLLAVVTLSPAVECMADSSAGKSWWSRLVQWLWPDGKPKQPDIIKWGPLDLYPPQPG